MEIITKLKKNIMLFFFGLPLFLIGYESFMTISTGTMGWAFLLFGQMLLVPISCYIIGWIFNLLNMHVNNLIAAFLFFGLTTIPIILFILYGSGMDQSNDST